MHLKDFLKQYEDSFRCLTSKVLSLSDGSQFENASGPYNIAKITAVITVPLSLVVHAYDLNVLYFKMTSCKTTE